MTIHNKYLFNIHNFILMLIKAAYICTYTYIYIHTIKAHIKI